MCCNVYNLIADEVRRAVKGFVANELTTVVQQSLDEILRTLYHDGQSSIQTIFLKVVPKVELDPLCRDFICNTLDAHILKFFDTDVASDKISKNLMTVKQKSNNAIENREKSPGFEP